MLLNELESLFVRAFADPGVRPAFYHLLMRSEVIVFSARGEPPPSIVAFPRDDGGQVVPIFTSENALLLNETVILNDPSAPCISWVPVRTVLDRARGMHLHINPKSQLNRGFTPEEIAWLLEQVQAREPMSRSQPIDPAMQRLLDACDEDTREFALHGFRSVDWFDKPLDMFRGVTPRQLVEQGREKNLADYLISIKSGPLG